MTDLSIASSVRSAWTSALGRTDLGGSDNFFLAGGHSMLGIRMMAGLSRSVGTRLPIRLLFDHPTMDELAAAVAAELTAPSAQRSL